MKKFQKTSARKHAILWVLASLFAFIPHAQVLADVVARERGKDGDLPSVTIVTAGGLDFQFPPPWKLSGNVSPMRVVTLTIHPSITDKKFEVAVFHFESGKETPDDFVRTLLNDFPDDKNPKIESIENQSTKITLARASGVYAPRGVNKIGGFEMAFAVITVSDGIVIVKLIGPSTLVRQHYDSFRNAALSPFRNP